MNEKRCHDGRPAVRAMRVVSAFLIAAMVAIGGCATPGGSRPADTRSSAIAPTTLDKPLAQTTPLARVAPSPAGQHASAANSDDTAARSTDSPCSTADELGIEVVGVRLTAAGYMLNFRYRVLDAEKVKPWVDRNADVFLLDEITGEKFYVPSTAKIGPLRQTPRKPRAGRTYFVMFKNTDHAVKAGRTVTVAVGDYEFRNLTVQ